MILTHLILTQIYVIFWRISIGGWLWDTNFDFFWFWKKYDHLRMVDFQRPKIYILIFSQEFYAVQP